MKSIAEYEADNAAAVAKYEAKRRAALRRLRQRIARIFIDELTTYDRIYAAIDAWAEKDFRRG